MQSVRLVRSVSSQAMAACRLDSGGMTVGMTVGGETGRRRGGGPGVRSWSAIVAVCRLGLEQPANGSVLVGGQVGAGERASVQTQQVVELERPWADSMSRWSPYSASSP